MSALDPNHKGSNLTLSNNNLTAAMGAGGSVIANTSKASGRWYWEINVTATGSGQSVGICDASANFNVTPSFGMGAVALAGFTAGSGNEVASFTAGSSAGISGTGYIMCAWDANVGAFWLGWNGVWGNGNINNTPVAGGGPGAWTQTANFATPLYPLCGGQGGGCSETINFGATPFVYTPPATFLPYDPAAPPQGPFADCGFVQVRKRQIILG